MVFDRVEFDKKAVAEFLDDLAIITNDPNDCTTAYDMFQLFKTWWKQYTNRSIVDLYEFNQYVREAFPEHCDGKRSFVGIKFGRKIGKDSDDPEIIQMIQFMDENFETPTRTPIVCLFKKCTTLSRCGGETCTQKVFRPKKCSSVS